jgi:hypothetical protein
MTKSGTQKVDVDMNEIIGEVLALAEFELARGLFVDRRAPPLV